MLHKVIPDWQVGGMLNQVCHILEWILIDNIPISFFGYEI